MNNERQLIADIAERIEKMSEAATEDFSALVKILGMSPQSDFVEADLSGLSLVGQRFVGCNFSGTDFSGSDLSRSSFENCDLTGARLVEAHVGWSVLKGCDLRAACLSGVTCSPQMYPL